MTFDEIRNDKMANYEAVLDVIVEKAKAGDRFFVELFLSHICQLPVAVERVPPATQVDGGNFVFRFDANNAVDILTNNAA